MFLRNDWYSRMNRHWWLHSVAPLTVITTAAIVAVGFALLATLLALSQPWLGIDFDRGYKGEGLRILKVQDYSSAHRELHSGDVILALASPTQRVEISALTFEEDPDRLSSYAEYNAFFAHQQAVFNVITSPSLSAVLSDGRSIPLVASTFPPLYALSWGFGWLLFFGGASLLLGVSAWSLRPRDAVTQVLAISGVGFMVGAYSCAIYASRELVLPAKSFFVLATANHLGIMIFAYASILFFWYYPQPYRKAPAAWIYVTGVLLLWLNETLQLFSWPIHAFYAHFLMAYTLLFSLSILQWRKSRGMPVERAALRWLMVTVLLSLGATVVLFYVPVILTGSPIASNVLTFGSVFLFYLGLVIGNIRYHQYDMDQWWLRAWQWLMFILIAMIADALFIYFLHVTQSVSIVLSIGVGVFYLLTRQWFWEMLTGSVKQAPNKSPPQMEEALNQQQQGFTDDMQWDQQITRIFNPIRLRKLPKPCIQVSFGEDANTLNIPSLDGLQTIEVFCCEKGKRLFTSTDIGLAARFLALMRQSQEAALSHERGVQEERQRILRDLHDDVAARLLTLLHQTREPEVSNTARNALRGLRDVIDRIGTEEMSLSDVMLDIEAASREQLNGVGVNLVWYSPATWPEFMLSSNLHINMRRIIREAIANALKHAQPKKVIIKVDLVDGELCLQSSHDGQIVDPSTWTPGRGLNNIKTRVAEMGASHKWVIDGAEGDAQYCKLTLCVPLA